MESKKCTKCGKIKTIDMFSKHSGCIYGVSSECKECEAKRKVRNKRTKKGLIKDIYLSQRSNAKSRGMAVPTYTKDELIEWMYSQRVFHELYDNWKASNYDKQLRPSCDRLDNLKSYTLDNLRVVTWRENMNQVHEDQKAGIDMRMNTPVVEVDDDGFIIGRIYHSIRFAERELGFPNDSIGKVCRGERERAYGRKFGYYETRGCQI